MRAPLAAARGGDVAQAPMGQRSSPWCRREMRPRSSPRRSRSPLAQTMRRRVARDRRSMTTAATAPRHIAHDAAQWRAAAADRLTVLSAPDLAAGWTGKLSAMIACRSPLQRLRVVAPHAAFVLFTDADISYEPGTLSVLWSRMPRLRTGLYRLVADGKTALRTRLSERPLIPAFHFLFPDALSVRVGSTSPRHATPLPQSAACMFVRRTALLPPAGSHGHLRRADR